MIQTLKQITQYITNNLYYSVTSHEYYAKLLRKKNDYGLLYLLIISFISAWLFIAILFLILTSSQFIINIFNENLLIFIKQSFVENDIKNITSMHINTQEDINYAFANLKNMLYLFFPLSAIAIFFTSIFQELLIILILFIASFFITKKNIYFEQIIRLVFYSQGMIILLSPMLFILSLLSKLFFITLIGLKILNIWIIYLMVRGVILYINQ